MWIVVWAGAAVASPWVEGLGEVRVGLSGTSLVSERQFAGGEASGLLGPRCPQPVMPGQRMPYSCVTGGTYAQRGVLLSGTVGLGRGVAVDVGVPLVVASFDDDVGRTGAGGVGDVRAGLRVGGLVKGWAIAGTLRVDAPTGPGTFQDRDVPLGNGQWEITPGVRVGRSLHPYGWVEMWQAVSIRARSARTGTDPGDEWRPVMALGLTPIEGAGVSLRVEGLLALPDEDAFGLSHPGRSLLQVRGAVFAQPVGPAWIEVGAAVPLTGRRWPAAISPYVSLSWLFARSGDG